MEKGSLGNALRKARIEKGYSQEKLAEIINITPTHLKHLESEHRKPSIEVLENLMQTLDLSFDMLVFPKIKSNKLEEFHVLLANCTDQELAILRDLAISLKRNRS